MSEILQNTGAKLWSLVEDHDELQSNVFDQLFGTGGKSDIRLIDEAIGKINKSLNGYYFKIINDKLYICKDTESGTTSLPLSITDDDGHVALKVDGTSITIDGNGVVHGVTIDDAFSLTSENAVQNKVVKAKFDEVDGKINANETTISSHKNDQNNPHNVTKSQLNLGNVEDKSSETIRSEITKENVTTALGYTPYTPNEVDNKFSTLETNIDWKEAVNTFDDIATTYPNPEDGWTVNTKDNNITYRYNGSEWVAISANAIPKATNSVDGLLSKEDHAKYDDAVSKAHTHDNKTVLDGITSDKVTAWDTVNNKVDKVDGKGLSTNDYTTTEKNKLAGIDKDLLDKLGESTEGNLTFNGDEINAAQMTGATADKDGTSGTVPAPLAGQEKLFLRGDGTWAEVTGGTKISPKATVNPTIINGNAKVTITWGDPDDVIADGVILSTWKGTKLVMKETGYPENENDGIVLVDNKIKDTYVSTGYEVTDLTNGNTYYFKLFPYSTDGIYNYQESNNLLGNPNLVKLDSCTNMSLSLAMGSVTVSWEDPNAEKTVDGNTATWAKSVLIYKQGSIAPSSVSDGIVAVEETTRNKYSTNGFVVDGLTNGEQYSFALFAVSTEDVSSDATIATANLWATLIITTGETTLYGKEVTATYGSSTVSGTFNNIGSATLQIPWIGETTITSTDGTDTATSVVTISAYESTYSVDLSFLKIVTFADGTDEEIAAMVQAHYDGKINISDYWAVGDTRTVSLSAMSATGVGESHRAQTVQFVIGDFEHDDLTTPINGHTKAAITLLQKDCLMDATSASNVNNGSADTEKGYMNSTNTNVGGWKSCARRTWCNNVYFSALPSTWQSMVKIVNKKSGTGGRSSSGTETTQDKIFLAAEIEIFGSTTYSFAGEGTQYQYYKNATANRYKMPKLDSSSASNRYWERSPGSGNTNYFCGMNYNGYADYTNANNAYGVAPCLCI